MLQFWKKSKNGSKDSVTSCSKNLYQKEERTVSVLPLSLFNKEQLLVGIKYERRKSRVPATFEELQSNKMALDYFIQYLQYKNASKYLMCWLDITAFKENHASSKSESDSLSVNTECESLTTDLSSTSDCSTTDNSLEGRLTYDCTTKTGNQVVQNALTIFKKYIAQEADDNINCPDLIRNQTIDSICNLEAVSSCQCFEEVYDFLHKVLQQEYFMAFLDSDYSCKYMIDIMTSGDVVLGDILHNETALFYFMEYLQQEEVCSLLEFWIAATHLQGDDQSDPLEAQSDAVVLYDKYFSLQAHTPLGFSDEIRFEIEQNICGENGLVRTCFDRSLQIVEHILEKHYLVHFVKSELFLKYLSELINAVQSNESILNFENQRNSSDCGSEKSSHAFLALELNKNQQNKRKDADMTIDTRDLCDPDSLWKRKYSSHRLSCGRVTALGKFETDLEPEPDERSFTLKKIVRNFINLNEDKKKEEMAWQVAEMIVKDITSVTLCQDRTENL